MWRCPSSQRSHSGAAFSKVAFLVAMPSWWMERTAGQSCADIGVIETSTDLSSLWAGHGPAPPQREGSSVNLTFGCGWGRALRGSISGRFAASYTTVAITAAACMRSAACT